MRRPNVLLIYTDQQRWDAIGFQNSNIKTPKLDALAAKGASFSHFFVNCPVCMPSRMSMLSGRYPASLNIACNGIHMPVDVPCIHNILKPYGYKTANIGKLHFINHSDRDHSAPHPDYGFDIMINSDEPGCYDDAYIKWVESKAPGMIEKCRVSTPPDWQGKPIDIHPRNTDEPYLFEGEEDLTHSAFVAEEVSDFIENSMDEPFFCVAGFYAPHCPLNPPERFVKMYDESQMPLPLRNEGDNYLETSDDEWRKIKAYYYALVSHVDEQVGKILDSLERSGKSENTLVIFTSDHGEYLGDYGRVQKGGPEDSSSRVPFIISGPNIKNASYNEICEAVDIVPTILDYCGVQIPPFMQGKTLKPLLENKEFKPRKSAFIQLKFPFGISYKAIRTREFLYMINNNGEEKLYDLRKSPYALNNVSDSKEYYKILSDMRREISVRWFDVENQYPLKTANY